MAVDQQIPQRQTMYVVQTSDKRRGIALVLCLIGFLGIGGLQHFYTGRIIMGLIYFFTFGLFFLGTIISLLYILTGGFKDNVGAPLREW